MDRRSFNLSLLGLLAGCGGESDMEYQIQPSPNRPGGAINTPIGMYAERVEWVPVLSFNGGTTGITYSYREGRYTRLGNIVIAVFRMVLTSKGTDVGTARVGGLPFRTTSSSGGGVAAGYGGAISFWLNMTSSMICMGMQLSSDHVLIRGLTAGATSFAVVTNTDFSNTTEFGATIIYSVNS